MGGQSKSFASHQDGVWDKRSTRPRNKESKIINATATKKSKTGFGEKNGAQNTKRSAVDGPGENQIGKNHAESS